MEINIKSAFWRRVFSNIIRKAIKNKTGVNPYIYIDNFTVKSGSGTTTIEINVAGTIETKDLPTILSKFDIV